MNNAEFHDIAEQRLPPPQPIIREPTRMDWALFLVTSSMLFAIVGNQIGAAIVMAWDWQSTLMVIFTSIMAVVGCWITAPSTTIEYPS